MKNLFSLLAFVAILTFAGCTNDKKDDKAEAIPNTSDNAVNPETPAGTLAAAFVAKPHVCAADCKDGQHVYAHGEIGHTCTAACGTEHVCTDKCKEGVHMYAHGENGHTCTEECARM